MMGRLPGQSVRASSIGPEWVRVVGILQEGRPGSAKSRRGASAVEGAWRLRSWRNSGWVDLGRRRP